MKLCKVERGVTRYQVSFTPGEAKLIAQSKRWAPIIRQQESSRGNVFAMATLTKHQINEVCDYLGVNGREWFAQQGVTV